VARRQGAERGLLVTLIDSHCHLDPEHFPEGPEPVLARARQAGVEHFVVVGVGGDLRSAERAVALAEQQPDVTAIVGMHPHDASAFDERLALELARLAAGPRVAAIGEVGLDYHYLFSPAEAQREVFRRMVRLARALGKPLVVHTREAAEDTLHILGQEGASAIGGIIHCFSEDLAFARRALDLGFHLSFSGIVTYKSVHGVHEVARFAPDDRILVETDSPYLAPVPVRGKRCEPAFVAHTARRLAELRGVAPELVAALTTANARRCLRLLATGGAGG
jgi:TatD DNase family protein